MTAAITNTFKSSIIKTLIEDLGGGAENNYYIALGKSDPWSVSDTPPAIADSDISSLSFVQDARYRLQSYKIVESSTLVVPRINWVEGTIYYGYDDITDEVNTSINPYYVMNENLRVYLCQEQGKDALGQPVASTVQPTGVGLDAFITSDGYVWKYMYQVGPEDANNHLTSNYLPVQYIDGAGVTAVEVEQANIQTNAIEGAIIGIDVVSPGSGYSGDLTVSITGNVGSSGASARAYQTAGGITHIVMDSDGAGAVLNGSGYRYASISVTGSGGGNNCVARAIYGPNEGVTADPTITLRSDTLMAHSDFEDNENNTIVSQNDFRQIALVKNPKIYNSNTVFSGNTGSALTKLLISAETTAFLPDKIVTNGSNASAFVVYYDPSTTPKSLYVQQTEETGFGSFSDGETITAVEGSGSGQGVLSSPTFKEDPDIDVFTGDILYINNVAPITRDDDQTEDIKIVIQL